MNESKACKIARAFLSEQIELEQCNELPGGLYNFNDVELMALLEKKGIEVTIHRDIVKDQGNHNTDAKADDRTRNKQEYNGKAPDKNSHIIVVDDTFTSGSTISTLIDHIKLQGVEVAQASTMAASRYQNWLKIPKGKTAKVGPSRCFSCRPPRSRGWRQCYSPDDGPTV